MRNNGRLCSRSIASLTLVGLLLSPTGIRADQSQNVIRAQILRLRNNNGVVLCALYASPDGFPSKGEKAFQRASAEIKDQNAVCEFRNIDPGTYAVSVLHDENSNGKMDTFLGIPKEGFGNSNDAKGRFGPPKFEDAAFHFTGGTLNLRITISYLM